MSVLQKIDISEIRKQFPLLEQEVHGKGLIYLDNGATTQKPISVINAISEYYSKYNANVHRGVHHLSQLATEAYENSRRVIRKYLNSHFEEEIIFTKGTTDGLNLLAFSIGETLSPGDEVIISAMEHHSNIVPWQMMCERKGCALKVIPINSDGELLFDTFLDLLSDKTKVVSVTHVSNSLGTINPVKKIVSAAHEKGAIVIIDGAQSVQHEKIDVIDLDCDFFVFSGHKIYGPTGIGALYGKKEILNSLPPYQGGGDMIAKVTFEKTTYNELPFKFEAGTPNIEGAIGLAAACQFVESIGIDQIKEYETELTYYAQKNLSEIEGVRIIGTAKEKTSVVSFIVEGMHPFDIGTLLDKQGIAVRTGHHCTQPLMDFFQIPGTVRASFSFYNTKEEIDQFIHGLKRAITMLS